MTYGTNIFPQVLPLDKPIIDCRIHEFEAIIDKSKGTARLREQLPVNGSEVDGQVESAG